jgi:hypothetical protein
MSGRRIREKLGPALWKGLENMFPYFGFCLKVVCAK